MSDLLETREGDVVRLTLNRPDRLNALSDAMTTGLRDALSRIADDASVGAVVLTGAGRGFCAGGDVQAMSAREGVSELRANAEITRLLAEMPQSIIAAVNGAAAGAGLALALACDFRLAGASARFGTAFLRLGLASDMGAAFFLRELVGAAKAKELFLLPDTLDAQAALDLGLVNRLVPDELLQQEAVALAQRLAAGPRGAQAALKRLLAPAEPLGAWLAREAQAQADCVLSADHREAVRAFIDKRPPFF
ncbi:enoyl-CoA hydratase-related protein [Falsiroseomonas sp. HW251]|uniref:enoyl-CoA hydratase-related protein n=1 Tax=Falsiroseomonas sp. HW251 TaxID=3390998 RepID=UPI003D312DA6